MSEAITPEDVKVYHNVNIASLATNIPGLLIWVGLTAMILIGG